MKPDRLLVPESDAEGCSVCGDWMLVSAVSPTGSAYSTTIPKFGALPLLFSSRTLACLQCRQESRWNLMLWPRGR